MAWFYYKLHMQHLLHIRIFGMGTAVGEGVVMAEGRGGTLPPPPARNNFKFTQSKVQIFVKYLKTNKKIKEFGI